jgi:cytoskeletal protein RodZ
MAVGARLRAIREERGLSVDDIARRTMIAPRILRAIEGDDFSAVPAGIFARGYLRAYAKAVGVSADEIIARYLEEHHATPVAASAGASTPASTRSVTPLPSALSVLGDYREYALIALAVAAVLLAVYLWPGGEPAPTTLRPQSTTAQSAHTTSGAPATPTGDRAVSASAARAAASDTQSTPADAAPAVHRRGSRDGLDVKLTAVGEVWVAAEADGKRVLYRLLAPREEVTLAASERLTLRVGDAGSLLVDVNGSGGLPAGPVGEVRDLTFNRDETR